MSTPTKAEILNAIYPVERLLIFGNGSYQIKRGYKRQSKPPIGIRSKIAIMSNKSLRRLMFVVNATQVKFKSMQTWTYPKYFPNNGEVVKADLSALLAKIRRDGMSYLWFLEFQERGAPHFHVLLDQDVLTPRARARYGLFWTERVVMGTWFSLAVPMDVFPAEVVKTAKFNTHREVWERLRSEQGGRNYVMKYASKQNQKSVPDWFESVGRFWGCSRNVTPKVKRTVDVTEDEIREWLAKHGHPASDWEVIPKNLWGVTE